MANMFINAMTDIWTNAGTVYNAIKMNVTNTSSSATSKLLLLQVGAVDKFSVDRDGAAVSASTISATGAFLPVVDDGAAVGSSLFKISDLYGASGFTLNLASGNWIATHTSGILTVGTGDLRVTTAGTNAASVATLNGAQTLVNKSLTAPTITGAVTSSSATWANLGTVTTIDINGGTIDGAVIGGASAAAGTFTTLTASAAVTLSPVGATVTISPTGGGVVTIFPAAAGAINNMVIGASTPLAGSFTTLTASGVATFGSIDINGGTIDGTTIGSTVPSTGAFSSLTASSTVTFSPANAAITMAPTGGSGTVTINPATAGTINNMSIGVTTRAAGAFTTLAANGAVTFSSGGTLTGTFTGGTYSGGVFTGGDFNGTVGAITPSTGAFTTLSASSTTSLSPSNASVSLSPTGTGFVTINPATAGTIDRMDIGGTVAATGRFTTVTATGAVTFTPTSGLVNIAPTSAGTINNMSIGVTTRAAGAFTTLGANSTVTLSPAGGAVVLSPTGAGTVTINPVGGLTVNPTAVGTMDNVNIGVTTRGTGAFTTLSATGLITATGGQISFPATQSASANVNTLDDYEEGTFTSEMSIGGGNTGITYTTQNGDYTKVGNVVAFKINLTLSSKGALSGDVSIGTLPFASTSTGICPVSVVTTAMTGLTFNIVAEVPSSSNFISLRVGTATGTTPLQATSLTNTSAIRLAGTYLTST